MKEPPRNLRLLFVLLVFVYSCRSTKVIEATALHVNDSYCAPSDAISKYRYIPLYNTDSLLKSNPEWPSTILLVANATGTLELIKRLKSLGGDTSAPDWEMRSDIRTEIQHRITLCGFDIAGIAAELDCSGESADQLGRYLDVINRKKITGLTVGSIIAGAITTVLTVVLKQDNAQNAAGIAGGAATTALGILTITSKGSRINLRIPRNTLHDIWWQPQNSVVYSPFVWYMLREKHFSNSRQASLAENIRKRWVEFDLRKEPSADDQILFFGDGGVFTADKIHTRADMLNELQSTIRSLNQQLEQLMQYLESDVYPEMYKKDLFKNKIRYRGFFD